MCRKLLIFISLVSIAIVGTLAQASKRGPRTYGEELPTSRSGRRPNPLAISIPSSEPIGCSKCLDDRYLAHYFKMGCTPKTGELICNKPCWKYFECPEQVKTETPEGCEYKGKVYKFREPVPVNNPCRSSCFCASYNDAKNISNPKIECADNDCFENFRALPPNCYAIYEEGRCCPKKFCANEEQAKIKCQLEGEERRLYQSMYSRVDPCVECQCNENWNQSIPLNENKNCKRRECDFEDDPRFKRGCIPIYHEGVCCPTTFHCPVPEEHQCKFDGKRYNIGEKIDINYNDRTECECIVPPMFTCIEKSVEQNLIKLSQPKSQGKSSAPIPSNKPKQENSSTTRPADPCPPYVEGGLTCAGTNCTTIIDGNGCQACQCQKSCPKLKCKSNCILTATTPGVCPECKCE